MIRNFRKTEGFASHVSPKTTKSGLKHPKAKLSDEQVIEIRDRLAKGEKGKSLAVEFAVSAAHISRIKLNQVKDWI